jgi:hypothetical protein
MLLAWNQYVSRQSKLLSSCGSLGKGAKVSRRGLGEVASVGILRQNSWIRDMTMFLMVEFRG